MTTSLDTHTHQGNVVLLHPTGSDAAGARQRKLTLQGKTAGGTLHTLLEILAQHEGASADQKCETLIYLNDGNDGTSPTLALTIASTGIVTFAQTPAGIATAASVTAAIATAAADATTKANAAAAASQPLDSDLTAIAALTTTSFGRALLPLADAAALRTAAGLGTLATQSGTFSGTSSGTNTGDQTITLTGDVTGSGTGSFAATIAAAAVTLAKMANLAQDTMIGRATASTGVPEAISCTAAGRALIDDADAAAQRTTLGLAAVASSGSASDLGTGTLPAGRLPAHTGDATSSAGSAALTIPAGTVTLAKQADIATARIQGRLTAATGVPEALTALQVCGLLMGQTAALTAPPIGVTLVFGLACPQNTTTNLRYIGPTATATEFIVPQGWKLLIYAASAGANGSVPPSGQTGTIKIYDNTADASASFGTFQITNAVNDTSCEPSSPPYTIDATSAVKTVEVKVVCTATTGSLAMLVTLFGVLIRP
jgi:hypothetical protein